MGVIPINIADCVGGTPLVRLSRLAPQAQLLAKIEWMNPGGSVKDRIGVAMLDAAEQDGLIAPGRSTIVEATSGNTGIALAFACAARGYELVLTLPQGMSRERSGLLRLYGAHVHEVESLGGMGESVAAARELAARDDYFLADQFANPANPEAHRRGTAQEILSALGGAPEVLVCGVGTGGTITGVGEVLKDVMPSCHVVAVEPESSPVLGGGIAGSHRIQGIGAGFVPPVLNRGVIDQVIPVADEDAIDCARQLARTEGLIAGLSAGAAAWAATQLAQESHWGGARILTILPDSGERYASTPFFAP